MAKRPDDLTTYRKKRSFTQTPEPEGKVLSKAGHGYLIQKHAATRLHYDFRLELDGVLKSWAVTKGPSLDPQVKRLAVHVEDHPVAYGSFEGIIPKGQYGGGTVMLWDTGTWEPLGDARKDLAKGNLKFRLHGERLTGEWALVRMHGNSDAKHDNWLLIKKADEAARPGDEDALLKSEMTSITSERSMEEIADSADRQWQSKPRGAVVEESAPKKQVAKKISGTKSAMPGFIAPELATLSEAMPKGSDWVHEIKFDGYRMQAHIKNKAVQLLTRTGKDWTEKFRSLAKTLAKLPVRDAVLDGEVVAMDTEGVSSFKQLQDRLSSGKGDDLQYYLFDLLYADGEDMRALPLLARKERLEALLKKPPRNIFYSEHFTQKDDSFLQEACKLRLEGVISKSASAPYHSGRGKTWLKTKCHQRQEFVIGGFTLPSKGGAEVGALLIGYYSEEQLIYAGKVGTGFTVQFSRNLRKKLEALRHGDSAFTSVPSSEKRKAFWVKPTLVCEIEFTEWTTDGALRHPSFQGLREDKPAREVHRDVPVAAPAAKTSAVKHAKAAEVEYRGVRISHPDRVLFKEEKVTKQMLAAYYNTVAEAMLPYVRSRPISLLRCPEGTGSECFFQRHLERAHSPHFHNVPVTVKGETRDYLMVKDAEGLLTVVQWGAIEIHPWGCPADDVDKPDYMVFDLDPDPSVKWKDVIAAASEVRERFKRLKMESFLRTTGGKGLHVVVPIARRYDWELVKAFAHGVASVMEADSPKRFTSNLSKAKRNGRIFVDYLRNGKTASAVASYSARAKSGATVATPLAWEELTLSLNPKDYTILTVPKRLKKDPWRDFHSLRQPLPREQLEIVKKLISA